MEARFPPAEQADYYRAENWRPFLDAFDRREKVLADGNGRCTHDGRVGVNVSGVETKLIQICGRFAERHASDLFISHATMMDLLSPHEFPDGEPERYLLLFGARRDGVDGNSFVLSRLANTIYGPFTDAPVVGHEYRSLLCMVISYVPDPDFPGQPSVSVVLKDITDGALRLPKEFLDAHDVRR